MQKKKLIYILHDLKTGGVETALLSAIPALADEFDLHIVCIGTVSKTFIGGISGSTESKIKAINLPLLLPLAILKAILYVKRAGPDIVISSLWKASIAGYVIKTLRSKCLLVSFIHNNKFFSHFDSFCTKLVLKKCDTIFCDSTASAKFITPYSQHKPVSIVSFLRFPTPQTFNPKIQLQLKAVFLGRISAQKRVDRLLNLIHQCKNLNALISLDIIGRDSESLKENLQKQAADLGIQSQIRFKDEVAPSQVQHVLSQYEFYMQTSDNEGMAMTVVEAMQLGLVPIVTQVGEIAHYAHNMENAIIIPKNLEGTDYLTNIVRTANDIDLYNKLSQNAHTTFLGQSEYAQDLIAKIEAAYQDYQEAK